MSHPYRSPGKPAGRTPDPSPESLRILTEDYEKRQQEWLERWAQEEAEKRFPTLLEFLKKAAQNGRASNDHCPYDVWPKGSYMAEISHKRNSSVHRRVGELLVDKFKAKGFWAKFNKHLVFRDSVLVSWAREDPFTEQAEAISEYQEVSAEVVRLERDTVGIKAKNTGLSLGDQVTLRYHKTTNNRF